jgi:hypothetical protein
MASFKFTFEDKTYELGEDNCDYFLNDEDKPVTGIEKSDILEMLNQAEEVSFDNEYYDDPCQNCLAGKKEKEKVFRFLEYHFFIFTKNSEYVTNNIYKGGYKESFTQLLRQGKVDDSYVVSIMVCKNCDHYSIEIEQCEI